jgi:uncharacterized protein (TIGR03435 family)
MIRPLAFAALALSVSAGFAQSTPSRPKFDAFEVATIKPTDSSANGRYIKMEGNNRFVEKYYTLQLLIAAAYDLNPRTISGGPAWINSEHYDIQAVTPGDQRPDHDEQMSMLRSLLTERFKLAFHREPKEFSIYALEVAKGGPKLKTTAASADDPVVVGPAVVYPERVVLPGRNASMGDMVSIFQRAILDRPVVDKTEIKGKYDFDLDWAPDETQFGGALTPAPSETPSAPLFRAIEEQMGLKLEAMRGPVSAMVIDSAERPSAN